MKDAFNEVLLHLSWSTHSDKDGGRSGHLVRRGDVSADLALEASPEFTNEEMQQIMFAAKRQAHKCLLARPNPKHPLGCHPQTRCYRCGHRGWQHIDGGGGLPFNTPQACSKLECSCPGFLRPEKRSGRQRGMPELCGVVVGSSGMDLVHCTYDRGHPPPHMEMRRDDVYLMTTPKPPEELR